MSRKGSSLTMSVGFGTSKCSVGDLELDEFRNEVMFLAAFQELNVEGKLPLFQIQRFEFPNEK